MKIAGGQMVAKAYPLLCRCVKEGVAYGWNRAYKHSDTPGEHVIQEEIAEAVMQSICEAFSFPELEEG
jgi:hypothetical protein